METKRKGGQRSPFSHHSVVDISLLEGSNPIETATLKNLELKPFLKNVEI